MNNNDYKYKIQKLCVIKNIVVLLLFTILSIALNKWGVVFFSFLFMSSIED